MTSPGPQPLDYDKILDYLLKSESLQRAIESKVASNDLVDEYEKRLSERYQQILATLKDQEDWSDRARDLEDLKSRFDEKLALDEKFQSELEKKLKNIEEMDLNNNAKGEEELSKLQKKSEELKTLLERLKSERLKELTEAKAESLKFTQSQLSMRAEIETLESQLSELSGQIRSCCSKNVPDLDALGAEVLKKQVEQGFWVTKEDLEAMMNKVKAEVVGEVNEKAEGFLLDQVYRHLRNATIEARNR